MNLTLTPPAPGLDVSFVVGTYGKAAFTQQMLASLARSMKGLKYEVIIVDNGSVDGTVGFLGTHTPGQRRGKAQGETPPLRVTVLHNPIPRALSVSWNMGIEAASGRYIVVANNDVIYTPGAVQAMVAAADADWQAGVVFPYGPGDVPGPKPDVSPPETPDAVVSNILAVEAWETARQAREFGLGREKQGEPQFETNAYVPQGGFCFLITRSCLERVGGFSPKYELTGEDYDMFKRVQRHFKMVRTPRAYVEHYEHQTCRDLGLEYNERMCRNRFLLAEKHENVQEIFSIVIPTYERGDVLCDAIDSVLAQTFQHWRLYIVDDGSRGWDHISRLLKKYDYHRNRIWHFHLPENQGPGVCRNYGLSQTRGKYAAFLDSDDTWHPDHLQTHFDAHERGSWAMVYSDADFAHREELEGGGHVYHADEHPFIKYTGEYDADRLRRYNYIQTSGVSVWGDLARSIKFPDRRTIVNDVTEDWEWFKAVADVSGEGRRVLHIPKRTCRYTHGTQPGGADHLTKRVTGPVPHASREVEVLIPLPAAEPLGADTETPGTEPVGVVIPTKGRPDDLRRALQSVGASAPCVVVDDGAYYSSTALDVVEGCNARGDCRAALLRTHESRGASWARNRGIEYLTTNWVQFLDDDDLLVGGWRETLLPLLAGAAENVAAVIGSAFVPNEDEPGMRIDDDVFTSQVCARRAALLSCGMFAEGLTWAEEREMLGRMERMGWATTRTGRVLTLRPQRGGSGEPASGVKHAAEQAQKAGHTPREWSLGGSGL